MPKSRRSGAMKIDRREFLRKAGVGSIALASLPTLANALAKSAWAQGGRSLTMASLSRAGPEGTAAAPAHGIWMAGQCHFDPSKVGSPVEGGGAYSHLTLPGTPPRPIVAAGTWKARLLVSYTEIGTWGVLAAGILEMVVDLFTQLPSPAVVRGARLKVVGNLPFGGLVNPGETAGYTLSVPGTDFFTGGTPGPFQPTGVGGTTFSTVPQ